MLSFQQISKRFGGVRALDDVTFDIAPNSIHAIVGENGAGKSTLMKIAAGVHAPDGGTLSLGGRRITIASPRQARDLGIALVPQEPALCSEMSVAENLNLGQQPSRLGFVSRGASRERAVAALRRVALEVSPEAPARQLSSAQRHLLQIARALAQEARILILDEPTASLSEGEAQTLFARLRALKQDGVTILYISHRLPEIFALCDAVTTLRDGRHVATQPIADITPQGIVAQMVGRELQSEEHQGEIVGLAGLVGSGRSEVARCIFGLDALDGGRMWLGEKPYAPRGPRDAIRAGLALVPEDRRAQGLVMSLSVRENLALPSLAAGLSGLSSGGAVRRGAERQAVHECISDLAIKTAGSEAAVNTLSGGNAQKVVIGKWLTARPQLLIVDEPTQGVDVGAKAQVHRLLRDLAARGFSVLMVSSDLPEVLHLSHRILVMREGRLAGELPHGTGAEDVMRLATLG